ncbi:MAG: sigma-70 family RNA polymerase sigma factor [Phycisphaerales bacterium]|nr:sigma-70 family RNA polymerase sigma factor [Phycisphaerales bacterium]MCB9857711.1 sigma-70 family RNA polymerase sigma factor [Phycisphaerales bacterium]
MSEPAIDNRDGTRRKTGISARDADKASDAARGLSDPARWVELHGDAMYRFALLRISSAELAEDAVQEAMLAALAARSTFDGRSSERTWLIGILRYKLIDLLRKRRKDRERSVSVDSNQESLFDDGIWIRRPDDWHVAGSTLESEEFQRILGECVGALPSPMREAFCLRVLDDVPSDEVCKCLDVSSTNLWTLVHRAKLRLRVCLGRRWFGNDEERSKRG